jgi:hypothetical protein
MYDAINQKSRKFDRMAINAIKKERKGKQMFIVNELDVYFSLL